MPNTAGDILRKLRGSKPRNEVAEALGISERALQAYELGERTPRDEVKKKIAEYYHRSVAYIFFAKPTTERERGVEDGT